MPLSGPILDIFINETLAHSKHVETVYEFKIYGDVLIHFP